MSTLVGPDVVSALMRILSERWVLTLALSERGESPYPTPLFYAAVGPEQIGHHAAPLLIFASSTTSHHGVLAGCGPTPAAAAVYLESETIGELRGAQLRGVVIREDRLTAAGAAAIRERYLERHAIAEASLVRPDHRLFVFVVDWAKLTDNRLGFGAHPEATFAQGWSDWASGWASGSSNGEVEQSPA